MRAMDVPFLRRKYRLPGRCGFGCQVDTVHDGHVLNFLMRHIYELIGSVLCRNDLQGQVGFHRIIIQQFIDIDLRSIVQCRKR